MKVAIAEGTTYITKDGSKLVAGEILDLPDEEAQRHILAGSMRPVARGGKRE